MRERDIVYCACIGHDDGVAQGLVRCLVYLVVELNELEELDHVGAGVDSGG